MGHIADAWRALAGPSPAAAGAGEDKASAVAPMLAGFGAGQPVWTPRRYDRLAREAYERNIIAFQIVNLIADSFASLRLLTFVGDDETPDHPAAALLDAPQPGRGGARLRQQWAAYHLIGGTSYLEATRPGPRRPPLELYAHRPDRLKVVAGAAGVPQAYRYELNGRHVDFPVDQVSGFADVLQCRDFHPLDDWYGMGPVEAAAAWVDLDNAGVALNAAMLQNGANPTTAFLFKHPLDKDQLELATDKITGKYGGVGKSGRPVVLGGDWDVKRISQTLAEMQWTEGMRESARRMCGAWGVPHVLVVPGESTYANRENGRLELWEHRVLPFADMLLGDLVPWLRWLFDEPELAIRYDRDAISALQPRRAEARKSAIEGWDAGIITRDEARLELDYGEAEEDGDKFKTAAPSQAPPPPPGGVPVGVPGAAPGRPALAVVQGGKAGSLLELKSPLPRALATKPLYVALRVAENSALALHAWAVEQGVADVVPVDEMHCTVVCSRRPVPALDLFDIGDTVEPSSYRLARLNGALVLTFESWMATHLHEEAARLGATYDFPEFLPHVTLSYEPGDFRLSAPPGFGIRLERPFAHAMEFDDDPGSKAAGSRPRVPTGYPGAGRFVRLARRGGSGFARYLIAGRRPQPGDEDGDGEGGGTPPGTPPGKAARDDDDIDPDDLVDDDVLADEMRRGIRETLSSFGQRTLDRIGFEVGFDVADPAVARFLEDFAGERIRGLVGATTRRELGAALARVTAEGPTFPALVAAVQETFERAGTSRAETIARTETTRAAAYGAQLGMVQGGIGRKSWLSSRDSWVRDSHAEMDGQVVDAEADYEAPSGATAVGPGLFEEPEESINCFPSDVLVTPVGDLRRTYARRYIGPLVTVGTAGGNHLSGTPNHPVLTRDGWKGLGQLREGDELVRDGLDVERSFGPDPGHAPTPIGEVHRLALETGDVQRVRGGGVDFHGDGMEGDVDVVTVYGLLASDRQAARFQGVGDLRLETSDVAHAKFSGAGVLPPVGVAAPHTPDRVVGGLHESGAPFGPGTVHANRHRAGTITGLDPERRESSSDDVAGAAEPVGERLLALAGEVEPRDVRVVQGQPVARKGDAVAVGDTMPVALAASEQSDHVRQASDQAELFDRVVEITVDARFDAHVYNLETSSGTYTANGFTVSNCRCISVPLPDEAAAVALSTKEARDVAWKAEADELAGHEEAVLAAVRQGFELQAMRAVARLRKGRRG